MGEASRRYTPGSVLKRSLMTLNHKAVQKDSDPQQRLRSPVRKSFPLATNMGFGVSFIESSVMGLASSRRYSLRYNYPCRVRGLRLTKWKASALPEVATRTLLPGPHMDHTYLIVLSIGRLHRSQGRTLLYHLDARKFAVVRLPPVC